MADKTFTIAGTSTVKGENTFRFATGKASVRAGVLKRNGHTDIDLRDLPSPMSKVDAVAFLEKSGITAILPISGRKPAVVKTPEQIAEEAAEAARVAKNEKRRLQRAAAKAAADEAFVAGAGDAAALIEAPADVEEVEVGTVDINLPESIAAE